MKICAGERASIHMYVVLRTFGKLIVHIRDVSIESNEEKKKYNTIDTTFHSLQSSFFMKNFGLKKCAPLFHSTRFLYLLKRLGIRLFFFFFCSHDSISRADFSSLSLLHTHTACLSLFFTSHTFFGY